MNFESQIETFLFVGKKKFSISVFKGDDQKIYNKEFYLDDNNIFLEELYSFLELTILDIEKNINQFINTVNLILEDEHFLKIDVSINNTKNNEKIFKQDVEYLIVDLKNKIQENNDNFTITSIYINNFKVKNEVFYDFDKITSGKNLKIETTFECVSNKFKNILNNELFKLEININKFISTGAIQGFLLDNKFDECSAAAQSFYNNSVNEVYLVSKNHVKKGFFEKFFHIFS